MSYIKNSSNDTIDLILISALPLYEKSESTSKLLNGSWVTQTIGDKAKKLSIKIICSYTVLTELIDYADTKEKLKVGFLDSVDSGFILYQPEYDVIVPGENPTCEVTIEMAVIPDV